MSVLDRAHRLAAQGKMADAVSLVRREAGAGDPEAQFALANWRLFGLHGERDPGAARALVDAAAAQGHVEAGLLQATLLANGAAGPADEEAAFATLRSLAPRSAEAREQVALIERVAEQSIDLAGRAELLSSAPQVRVVRRFLDPAEADYLKRRSERHLRPSFIEDPVTRRRIPHPTRTSFGMSFGPTLEDAVVRRINRRIAQVSGTEIAQGEPLHILRYAPGQEYKPHVDTLPGVTNQRAWTVLLYLNEEYDGGETVFDALDVRFAGGVGDALIFASLDAEGRPDPRSRHAGLPIRSGTKWIATRWIRQAPVDPFA